MTGTLASAIKLFRVSDGALVRTLTGHRGGVNAVAFSPDGQILASAGGYDTSVRLWRVSDGMLLRSVETWNETTAIAFLADGASFLVGTSTGRINRRSVADGVWRDGVTAHSDAITALALSPDGRTLASSSWDKTAKLWRLSDMRLLQALNPNSRVVNDVAFAPDGQTVGTAGDNYFEPKGEVTFWNVEDGTEVCTLGLPSGALSLAFAPDGRTLVTTSYGYDPAGTVRLWSVPDCAPIPSPPAPRGSITSLTWSPDAATLAAASSPAIWFWNASDGGLSATRSAYPHPSQVAFSPDGRTFVSGSAYTTQYGTTGELLFWNPADLVLSSKRPVSNGA